MPTEKNTELAALIRRDRLGAGKSLTDLAHEAGMDRTLIFRIERGEVVSPGPDKLQRLARALGKSASNYFALAGYTTPTGLPEFGAYLRAKYDVDPIVAAEAEEYFNYLRTRHSENEVA